MRWQDCIKSNFRLRYLLFASLMRREHSRTFNFLRQKAEPSNLALYLLTTVYVFSNKRNLDGFTKSIRSLVNTQPTYFFKNRLRNEPFFLVPIDFFIAPSFPVFTFFAGFGVISDTAALSVIDELVPAFLFEP